MGWGAYGRALAGQSWQEILEAYYGGTQPGVRTDADIRVRLTEWDDADDKLGDWKEAFTGAKPNPSGELP